MSFLFILNPCMEWICEKSHCWWLPDGKKCYICYLRKVHSASRWDKSIYMPTRSKCIQTNELFWWRRSDHMWCHGGVKRLASFYCTRLSKAPLLQVNFKLRFIANIKASLKHRTAKAFQTHWWALNKRFSKCLFNALSWFWRALHNQRNQSSSTFTLTVNADRAIN